MDFTTTTEIARAGSKSFKISSYSIVMNNNKPVGLIFGTKLTKKILDAGILEQLREEVWEMQDKETRKVVAKSKKGDFSSSISLDDYIAKYGI